MQISSNKISVMTWFSTHRMAFQLAPINKSPRRSQVKDFSSFMLLLFSFILDYWYEYQKIPIRAKLGQKFFVGTTIIT